MQATAPEVVHGALQKEEAVDHKGVGRCRYYKVMHIVCFAGAGWRMLLFLGFVLVSISWWWQFL